MNCHGNYCSADCDRQMHDCSPPIYGKRRIQIKINVLTMSVTTSMRFGREGKTILDISYSLPPTSEKSASILTRKPRICKSLRSVSQSKLSSSVIAHQRVFGTTADDESGAISNNHLALNCIYPALSSKFCASALAFFSTYLATRAPSLAGDYLQVFDTNEASSAFRASLSTGLHDHGKIQRITLLKDRVRIVSECVNGSLAIVDSRTNRSIAELSELGHVVTWLTLEWPRGRVIANGSRN